MDRNEIEKILPHRECMLLIDSAEVINLEDGTEAAQGFYHVTGDEFFLKGHFPGNPIVPGVILCEIMAQSVCVLLANAMAEAKNAVPVYTGMKEVKFRDSVRPGDTIRTECKITRAKKPFYFAAGKAYVGDRLCAQAEFSFALREE